ncbi:MAG TPA: hypothetical protein VGP79_00405 [Bryobacteraceae bacterium]|nr:hypothetical protein [Bryobacteraceae bacterium]
MWAFPAALVIASLGPFALTAAVWILADAPAHRLTRWWALPALLLSYVFVPIYAIRRSGLQRYTAALIFAIALGTCIWLSGRVDWGVGKDTYLSTLLSDRGVRDDWAHYFDPSNPTPLVMLIWFLVVAILSIIATRAESERGDAPSRGEMLLGAVCAMGSAAGWLFRPQHYEESGRMIASSLAILLAIFAFVIFQRGARVHFLNKILDQVLASWIAMTLLRALTVPNPNGFASERLRSMSFNFAPIRSYLLPLAAEASCVAGGVLILIDAARQKRALWMAVGLCMVISGIASSLGTLQILSGPVAWLASPGAQVLLCGALAALFVLQPEKRSDRDIIIPAVGRDTA